MQQCKHAQFSIFISLISLFRDELFIGLDKANSYSLLLYYVQISKYYVNILTLSLKPSNILIRFSSNMGIYSPDKKSMFYCVF